MEPEEYYTKEELLTEFEYYKEGVVTEEKVGRFILLWTMGGDKSYEFIVADWAMSDGDGSNCRYSKIAQGWVCFDGVRHLWYGYQKDPEMNGYDNYPDIDSYIEMLKRIKDINERLGIER